MICYHEYFHKSTAVQVGDNTKQRNLGLVMDAVHAAHCTLGLANKFKPGTSGWSYQDSSLQESKKDKERLERTGSQKMKNK